MLVILIELMVALLAFERFGLIILIFPPIEPKLIPIRVIDLSCEEHLTLIRIRDSLL